MSYLLQEVLLVLSGIICTAVVSADVHQEILHQENLIILEVTGYYRKHIKGRKALQISPLETALECRPCYHSHNPSQ